MAEKRPDARTVKKADKDAGDSRALKLHGSGYKREYFVATARASAWARTAAKGNRRP